MSSNMSSNSISNSSIFSEEPRCRDLVRYLQLYSASEVIASGGFGTVYAGFRKCDHLPVAVKFIKEERTPVWEQGANGLTVPREVACLEKVAHVEGAIRLLDWFVIENGPRFVLVMERPEHCEDLFELFVKQPSHRFEEGLVRHLFIQLMKTVQACHQAGVLHNDIKEENIILNKQTLSLKLIDFGLAGHLIPGKIYRHFAGTSACAPPEWFQSKQYKGVDAEIWAMGLLLFRLLTGSYPFENIEKVSQGELTLDKAQVSPKCLDMIRKCLAVNPLERISLEDMLLHPWITSGLERANE